jgi:hypothetical protein
LSIYFTIARTIRKYLLFRLLLLNNWLSTVELALSTCSLFPLITACLFTFTPWK